MRGAMARLEERPPWKTAVALAAGLYLIIGRRHGVGLVSDDAEYILAARQLACGSGFFQKLLNHHLLGDRLPGFPLLLMPVAAFAHPPFELLKAYPWGLTVLSCVLFWKLLDGWLAPGPRFAALVLYAFNPLVADYAGRVMSESLFCCVTLASLLLTRDVMRGERGSKPWLLGILLAWATVIRGEGFFLLASTALASWRGRSRRTLGPALGAALFAGAIYLGNYLSRRTPAHYIGFWLGIVPQMPPDYFIRHVFSLPVFFTWIVLLGAPGAPSAPSASAAAVALALFAAVLSAAGLRRLENGRRRDAGALFAIGCFCLLYSLAHALWPDSDERFFLALVPFAVFAVVAGASNPGRRFLGPRWLLAGMALWLLSYGNANARAALETLRRAPEATLGWIQENTPASSRIWAFYDYSLVELYTQRRGIFFGVPDNEDAFRHRLFKEGIDYVYYAPLRFSFEPVPGIERVERDWGRSRNWVAAAPAEFERVYDNPGESTAVYRVLPDDSFEKAYALYLDALEDFQQGLWDRGLSRLDESLRRRPHLVSALNAYGATCLVARCDLRLAERRLQEAVKLQPDYALAGENLARLRRKLGRSR